MQSNYEFEKKSEGMQVNATNPQVPISLDNRKQLTSVLISPGVSLTTKPPHGSHGRQISTKTVNLKNNNFISNNPFLSLNANWMTNSTTANNQIFNTITISNKSNTFYKFLRNELINPRESLFDHRLGSN